MMKTKTNMRYIQLFIATALWALLTVSCDRDLPYPIDEVKKGVVIDIVRAPDSDGVLSAGVTDGDYKVSVSIPKQQGDYSMLDYAQLLCVFTDVDGKTTSKVIVDNIKEFPKDISIDIASVYQQFGKEAPTPGEIVYFTTNAVLKDGYTVYGWTEYSDFNNKLFTGWEVDGRAYSYNVRYPVACQLVLEEFVGPVALNDFYDEYRAEIVKTSDTELEIHGVAEGEDPDGILKLTIDTSTHTVKVAKQIVAHGFVPWIGYNNLAYQATGTIDACKGTITLNGPLTVDEGSFGDQQMIISTNYSTNY